MNICQNLIIWSCRIESKKLQSAHQDRKMCAKFRTEVDVSFNSHEKISAFICCIITVN